MKKILFFEILFLLLLGGVLFVLLYEKGVKDVPLSRVRDAFEAGFPEKEAEEVGAMRTKRAFGLNPPDYAEILYFAPDNTMSVDEFFVVKLKDPSQQSAVLSAIEDRIAVQKKNFDGYGTDQTDLLNHAVTVADDIYVGLFIGKDAEAWAAAARKVWEE